MGVVMAGELGEDPAEMGWSDNEQVIEAFSADGADPPFRVGVGVGCPDRGGDDTCADRAPDVVEGPGELGVAVPDEVSDDACGVLEGRGQVPVKGVRSRSRGTGVLVDESAEAVTADHFAGGELRG